jgi:hypothetical protein
MATNDPVLGSGVRVEIALTYGTAIPVSAITLANPAVVTATAHGLSAKSAGYFDSMVGMEKLDGQGARVDTVTANNFSLLDIDTSAFGAHVSGNFIPVLTWGTLAQARSYGLGGGAAKTEDATCLIDTREVLISTRNAAETVSMDVLTLKVDNAAMKKLRATGRALDFALFRITFLSGEQRIFRGQPSIPGESVSQSALGTGQLSVTVKGQIVFLPS